MITIFFHCILLKNLNCFIDFVTLLDCSKHHKNDHSEEHTTQIFRLIKLIWGRKKKQFLKYCYRNFFKIWKWRNYLGLHFRETYWTESQQKINDVTHWLARQKRKSYSDFLMFLTTLTQKKVKFRDNISCLK